MRSISKLLATMFLLPVMAVGEIDNSQLIPRWLPDSEVKMEGLSPDWVKSLIMVQFRIETATPEGTFASATRVLDHYAEMGVNGLWINPIYQRGSKQNGYGNFGPDTIEPLLTGAEDLAGSFAVVRKFVDEAHRRNIRVIFDIVAWGTTKNSPLVAAHPEFYERKDGRFREVWGGYAFDWSQQEFRSWYREAAVRLIKETGADGFRVDLAPDVSGYFFESVRERLLAEGKKIIVVSEMPGERKEAFDFEQIGVTGWTEEPDYVTPGKLAEQKARFGKAHDYLLRNNLVDVVRTGRGIGSAALQQQGKGGGFRYYTANLLCHDDADPAARGDRITFAYANLFGPFIPLWWIGEEWNNPKNPLPDPSAGGVMYGNQIDWQAKAANREFFEDIKQFIRIRRSYPAVFENFPASLRDANIAKCDSTLNGAPNPLQAYRRTGDAMAILIVPNPTGEAAVAEISVAPGTKSVTDLMTGKPIPFADTDRFKSTIPSRALGIYLVKSTTP